MYQKRKTWPLLLLMFTVLVIIPGGEGCKVAKLPEVQAPVCDGDFFVNVCNTKTGDTIKVYQNGNEIASAPCNGTCVSVDLGGTPLNSGDIVIARRVRDGRLSPRSVPVTVTAGGTPVYDTTLWNDPAHQFYNNCYNYGCDMITDTFAQPGRAHSAMYTSLDCANVGTAAEADELVTSPDKMCANCTHIVALVMDPGTDYHWYRRDRNGNWSHKPGGTPATNLDASGNPITNPETANRNYGYLNYNVFCGYYCVDKSKVVIQ